MNISIEICSAMGEEALPIVKLCMPMIKQFAPNFIHPCPYEGRNIGVEDFPIDISLLPLVQLSSLPKGDYRIVNVKFRTSRHNFSICFVGHNFSWQILEYRSLDQTLWSSSAENIQKKTFGYHSSRTNTGRLNHPQKILLDESIFLPAYVNIQNDKASNILMTFKLLTFILCIHGDGSTK